MKQNPDKSWTASGGSSLSAISVTRIKREDAQAQLVSLIRRPELAVWYGKMPESNGKSNWTAILYRKGEGAFMGRLSEGITIDRSEYEDRVRYEADRMRYLIGELDQEPDMLAYDEKLRSDYVYPPTEQQVELAALRRQLASAAEQIEELQVAGRQMAACGEDLLERLVNVTEGDDDSISDEEISEIKATFGIAGEDD